MPEPIDPSLQALEDVFGVHVRIQGGEEWSSVSNDFRERFSEDDWQGFRPEEFVPFRFDQLIVSLEGKPR